MSETIRNCYDSHTHFWATGQVAAGLKLHELNGSEEVSQLHIGPEHYRGEWLTGFGWNHHKWHSAELPTSRILDQAFSDTPVFFSRVDGHCSWINSAAIRELQSRGYNFQQDPPGGRILRDRQNEPSGILLDQAHIAALQLLPDFSRPQHQFFLKTAQHIFNQAGFTHVRDLSMNLFFWQMLREMEQKSELTVFVDGFMTAETLADAPRVLEDIGQMQKDESQQLRIHGVKIFIDGSLGSKTAFLSQPYSGSAERGLLIWNHADIKELLRTVWRRGLQVAIHTIGDEAVHTAVSAAREVSAAGTSGRLHLEHVQMIRPETLKLMKPLHVTCHMQPCHWISDQSWLRSVLPEHLWPTLFPWEQLRKNKIHFDFGSDSPIEPPSLFNTKIALEQSAAWGIPQLQGDWKTHHAHPDTNWGDCRTEIADGRVKQVFFQNRPLM